mmetsp:Transcript_38126/g.96429  ORF Transcript_38126/g.96429 Transcript_38126/m.96429 type:complete len:632 (-) Transcript_38126:372-2267(-)|eukprot:CAMPEP_0202859594 /NCGR_PEP_ID=MMETSP1391-20130828/1639_1 /ASSEMBLY_ACC=CAM_ASM_000867 /TAXON_ID=1034604 /ORGANISM="Chlamydomonas leiostraca, Strain SAG 11-49" /LENGTH=631 /DNA_ID=CAMNT_0049538643 /DNA_START=128 /DNA_END=2023 /DNA_ORIENTATION=+
MAQVYLVHSTAQPYTPAPTPQLHHTPAPRRPHHTAAPPPPRPGPALLACLHHPNLLGGTQPGSASQHQRAAARTQPASAASSATAPAASVQAVARQALQDAVRVERVRQHHLAALRLAREPAQQLRLRVAHHNGRVVALQHEDVVAAVARGHDVVLGQLVLGAQVLQRLLLACAHGHAVDVAVAAVARRDEPHLQPVARARLAHVLHHVAHDAHVGREREAVLVLAAVVQHAQRAAAAVLVDEPPRVAAHRGQVPSHVQAVGPLHVLHPPAACRLAAPHLLEVDEHLGAHRHDHGVGLRHVRLRAQQLLHLPQRPPRVEHQDGARQRGAALPVVAESARRRVLRGVTVLADHGAVNVGHQHEARLRAARERADGAPRQLERPRARQRVHGAARVLVARAAARLPAGARARGGARGAVLLEVGAALAVGQVELERLALLAAGHHHAREPAAKLVAARRRAHHAHAREGARGRRPGCAAPEHQVRVLPPRAVKDTEQQLIHRPRHVDQAAPRVQPALRVGVVHHAPVQHVLPAVLPGAQVRRAPPHARRRVLGQWQHVLPVVPVAHHPHRLRVGRRDLKRERGVHHAEVVQVALIAVYGGLLHRNTPCSVDPKLVLVTPNRDGNDSSMRLPWA